MWKQAAKNWYQLGAYGGGVAHHSLGGMFGAAGRTAMYGAAAGGMYGAVSSDTSVLGGALGGTALGLGGRWGRAGLRAGRNVGAGMGFGEHAAAYGSAFAGGVGRRVSRDIGAAGARLRSNSTYSRVSSSLKGWRG